MSYKTEKSSLVRSFWPYGGVTVSGVWAWANDVNQTIYQDNRTRSAGSFMNSGAALDLEEYKYENIYLPKGSYKFLVVTIKASNRGILEILYGNTSLGILDCYSAITSYDFLWEPTFLLENPTTADIRFRVNGKHASATNYWVAFSIFKLNKVG